MSSRRDQISAGVTRYLCRYLQISADICRYLQISVDICADICRYLQILFMKVSAYNTIIICSRHNYHVSAAARRSRTPRGPITFVAFVAFVATASLLAAAAVTSSSGTIVVPPPLPPRGDAVVFGGGQGCRRCRRHSRSCSPRRQGDARRCRRQDGGRRQALPDHHPPCPSPLATSS